MLDRDVREDELVAGVVVDRPERLRLLDRDGGIERLAIGEKDRGERLQQLFGLLGVLDLRDQELLGMLPVMRAECPLDLHLAGRALLAVRRWRQLQPIDLHSRPLLVGPG
jgi:hypothetical protein